MIDMSIVASKLSNAHREKGFTQEELAVRLGVSSQAISKWERALSLPDIDLLLDVSKVLDIPINYLLDANIQESSESHKTVYDIAHINILDNIRFDQIKICFGIEVIPVFTTEYIQSFAQLRREYLIKYGVLLPYIRIMDDATLKEKQCRIVVLGKVQYDCELKAIAEDAESIKQELLSSLKKTIDSNLHLFVNRHMVKLLLEKLKCGFPFCVEGVVPERLSLSKLKVILKTLVKRGNSISDLYTIIETIDDNIDDISDVSTLVEIISKAMLS